ncbi:hypothetical protein RF11_02614 [Thelohanellus kitauei]|uniref:Uncharacterized protein n=1 Tax=Thelohanellus kitauei TaxID=669202 RepID=A0A0C2MB89_THEKT|nr:hypothetical protein RF11_02614 [Thelohanellus kitauei]
MQINTGATVSCISGELWKLLKIHLREFQYYVFSFMGNLILIIGICDVIVNMGMIALGFCRALWWIILVPHSLVSDTCPSFIMEEMKVLSAENQIKHIRTTAYHSRKKDSCKISSIDSKLTSVLVETEIKLEGIRPLPRISPSLEGKAPIKYPPKATAENMGRKILIATWMRCEELTWGLIVFDYIIFGKAIVPKIDRKRRGKCESK